MLTLKRYPRETLIVGDGSPNGTVMITVQRLEGGGVKLSIQAAATTPIMRDEVYRMRVAKGQQSPSPVIDAHLKKVQAWKR